jgi:dienelactone hydrolase
MDLSHSLEIATCTDPGMVRSHNEDSIAADPGNGLVVLPDVRGLYRFYEELALRFAEAGIDALAIDYFGRTAATSHRADDFDFMGHVQRARYASLISDVAAAADHQRTRRDVRAPRCTASRLKYCVAMFTRNCRRKSSNSLTA